MPAFPATPDDLATLFDEAVQLVGAERAAYLAQVQERRPALGDELVELVKSHESDTSLLDAPLAVDLGEDLAGNLAEDLAGGSTSASGHGDLVGSMVGDLAIVQHIGEGGMGDVYEALQERPRRRVALKVLRDERRAGERFRIESEALARLDHPHIAKVYGAGEAVASRGRRGFSWMAFEHIQGARSVTEYADGERLSLEARVQLFIPVAEAIQHAHHKGVLHRDLKPANLLVGTPESQAPAAKHDARRGVAKVIDFGLARFSDEIERPEQERTRHGELLGTLRYMSPEQCSGDPNRIDARSDIYGLGVVLYELVTGELPYDLDGASILQIMERIRTSRPRDPRTLDRRQPPGMAPGAQIDEDLSAVILRAVDKEPSERYASAGELAADLGRWLAREPVHARRPGVIHRVRLFARRRRPLFVGLCAGAAAAAAALVVIAALFFDNRAKVKEIREQEAIAAARAEEVLEARSVVAGLREQFRGLDGSLIAGGIVDQARSATMQASGLAEQRLAIERALEQLNGLVALLGDDVEGARELADAFVEVGGLLGRAWSASAEESKGALAAYRSASALARRVHARVPRDSVVAAWLGGILVKQAGACRKVGSLEEGRACADEAVALARHGVRPGAGVAAIMSLLDALNERGDLHIQQPPYRQGLLDAQEALGLVDRLASLDVPERERKEQRRWVLLRLGHWMEREGNDPAQGARLHREARAICEWMLEGSLGSDGAYNDAWLLYHIFGWNEVGAYARLGDDAEVDRAIVELAKGARAAVAAGLGDAALVPATLLSMVALDRVKGASDDSAEKEIRVAWEAMDPKARGSAIGLARQQTGVLGSVGVDVTPVHAFLDSVTDAATELEAK